MDWAAYFAELLNRQPALTDPKTLVTVKAGDFVREIRAAFDAGKAKDQQGVQTTN